MKKTNGKCEWCDGEKNWHTCPNCGSKWTSQKVRKSTKDTELQCWCIECLEFEEFANNYG